MPFTAVTLTTSWPVWASPGYGPRRAPRTLKATRIRFAEVAGPHYPCLNRLLAPEGLKYLRIGEFLLSVLAQKSLTIRSSRTIPPRLISRRRPAWPPALSTLPRARRLARDRGDERDPRRENSSLAHGATAEAASSAATPSPSKRRGSHGRRCCHRGHRPPRAADDGAKGVVRWPSLSAIGRERSAKGERSRVSRRCPLA